MACLTFLAFKDMEKQKYLKNNSDSLTLYKNKGLQNMEKIQ